LHLGNALEQHLPHPRQHPHRDFGGEFARAQPLGFAEGDVVGGRRHDLDAGDEIDEFGQIGQHHDRIGAGVILLAKLPECAGDVAANQMFEKIDHAGAIGKPEHLPHGIGANRTCSVRDRLIEQR